jgi:hypothetical protein
MNKRVGRGEGGGRREALGTMYKAESSLRPAGTERAESRQTEQTDERLYRERKEGGRKERGVWSNHPSHQCPMSSVHPTIHVHACTSDVRRSQHVSTSHLTPSYLHLLSRQAGRKEGV